jgi:hypothetical protein
MAVSVLGKQIISLCRLYKTGSTQIYTPQLVSPGARGAKKNNIKSFFINVKFVFI